jgi:hypothetical protein
MLIQQLLQGDLSQVPKTVDVNKLSDRVNTMWQRTSLGYHPQTGPWGKPPYSLEPPYLGRSVNPVQMEDEKSAEEQQLDAKYEFNPNWRSDLPENQEQQ